MHVWLFYKNRKSDIFVWFCAFSANEVWHQVWGKTWPWADFSPILETYRL